MGNKKKADRRDGNRGGIAAMRTLEFSQKFAGNIMHALGVNNLGVISFQNGRIPKSVYFPPLCQMDIADRNDCTVIDQLSGLGMLVYYVIPSYWRIDGGILEMTCYLCVPKDVVEGTLGDAYQTMSTHESDSTVWDYIECELDATRRGYAYAYVINHNDEFGEFGSVLVKSEQGVLFRTF